MSNPELLCLDEPAAGLDMGARERLLERLGAVMAAPTPEGAVLVTHHVEEIPPFMTHGALLREGALVASGPLEEVMTSKRISTTFGIEISLQRDRDGRYSARGRT
jgi:iron complex transport system ATP-binding protein